MTFASSFVLLTSFVLATGCASSMPRQVQSAGPVIQPQKPNRAGQVVELRHIYLLSPGPNSTLVVTRSDVPPPTAQ